MAAMVFASSHSKQSVVVGINPTGLVNGVPSAINHWPFPCNAITVKSSSGMVLQATDGLTPFLWDAYICASLQLFLQPVHLAWHCHTVIETVFHTKPGFCHACSSS
jgi:hypothetical protein